MVQGCQKWIPLVNQYLVSREWLDGDTHMGGCPEREKFLNTIVIHDCLQCGTEVYHERFYAKRMYKGVPNKSPYMSTGVRSRFVTPSVSKNSPSEHAVQQGCDFKSHLLGDSWKLHCIYHHFYNFCIPLFCGSSIYWNLYCCFN